MKKKPYLLLVTFSLIFILGNVVSIIPSIPTSPRNTSPAAPEGSNIDELIDIPWQVEDNKENDPESKETEDVQIREKQYQQSAVDPTSGSFAYDKTLISYNWVDASGGTWNDLSGASYLPILLPFVFPMYGENFSVAFVSRHGWLSFYNTQPDRPWVGLGSSNEDSWYAVGPFATPISWEYGDPGFFNLTQTSPSRVIFEYNNVYSDYWPNDMIGTFQVILYENGTIDFNYDFLQDTGAPYSAGLNHGAISDNFVSHTFGSFPVIDVSIRFTPPEKWLFITSSEQSASTAYTLEWEGHSNVTIDRYHVFVNSTYYYGTTPLEYFLLPSLSTGWNWVEVYMETDGTNYTTGMQLLVDTDKPLISIEYPIDWGSLYDAKVNWTASDWTSNINYFEIIVDDVYLKTLGSSITETYLVLPNEEWHNITVVAYDLVGNYDWDNVTIWYNRTVPAAGFVRVHGQDDLWDVQNYYGNQGYAVEVISDSLTLSRLKDFDVIFIGGGGMDLPGSDQTIIMNYVDNGGKLVVVHNWGFPSGLDTVLENYGLVAGGGIYKDPDNTTHFDQYHPLMNGVAQLQCLGHDVSFDVSFPFRELVHDADGENLIGAVYELGPSKILCLESGLLWDIYKSDNTILLENMITNWITLEDHDVAAYINVSSSVGMGQTVEVNSYVINQGTTTETSL
ncbi:MAG: hypothetical protein ACFFAY_09605, partial [Promethearchaeota archaeon]